MKNFILVSLIFSLIGCSPVFAAPDFENQIPRMTDLKKFKKKPGADNLATEAKNANSVAALRAVVLKLIESETGGK